MYRTWQIIQFCTSSTSQVNESVFPAWPHELAVHIWWISISSVHLNSSQKTKPIEMSNCSSHSWQWARHKAVGFDHSSVLIGSKGKAERQSQKRNKCNKMHCFHYNDLCCMQDKHITHIPECVVDSVALSIPLFLSRSLSLLSSFTCCNIFIIFIRRRPRLPVDFSCCCCC